MVEFTECARELLGRPLPVNLATTRPEGAPQVNPMWFIWDGEFRWFTHSGYRQMHALAADGKTLKAPGAPATSAPTLSRSSTTNTARARRHYTH